MRQSILVFSWWDSSYHLQLGSSNIDGGLIVDLRQGPCRSSVSRIEGESTFILGDCCSCGASTIANPNLDHGCCSRVYEHFRVPNQAGDLHTFVKKCITVIRVHWLPTSATIWQALQDPAVVVAAADSGKAAVCRKSPETETDSSATDGFY